MRREAVSSKESQEDLTRLGSVDKLRNAMQKLSNVDDDDVDPRLLVGRDEYVDQMTTTTYGLPTPDSDELDELNAEPRGPQGITDDDDPGVDHHVMPQNFQGEESEEDGESVLQLGTERPGGSIDDETSLNEISNHSDNLVKDVVQSYLNSHKDQLRQLIQSQAPGLQKPQRTVPMSAASPSQPGSNVEHETSIVNAIQLGTPDQREQLNSMLAKLKKDKGLLEGAENLQDQAADAQDEEFKKTERARIAVDTTEDSFLQLKAQMLQELRDQLKQKEARLISGYNKKKKELEDMQMQVKDATAKGQKHLQQEARRLHVMKRRLAKKVNRVIQRIIDHWMSGAEAEASTLGDSDAAGLDEADDELD